MPDRDCELTLDTDELEYYLETGEMHRDMDKALEFLLTHAIKHGKATCTFTINKSVQSEDVVDD